MTLHNRVWLGLILILWLAVLSFAACTDGYVHPHWHPYIGFAERTP